MYIGLCLSVGGCGLGGFIYRFVCGWVVWEGGLMRGRGVGAGEGRVECVCERKRERVFYFFLKYICIHTYIFIFMFLYIYLYLPTHTYIHIHPYILYNIYLPARSGPAPGLAAAPRCSSPRDIPGCLKKGGRKWWVGVITGQDKQCIYYTYMLYIILYTIKIYILIYINHSEKGYGNKRFPFFLGSSYRWRARAARRCGRRGWRRGGR